MSERSQISERSQMSERDLLRIPPEIRTGLDLLAISVIVVYLGKRLGIPLGSRELRLKFRNGRYDRHSFR